MIPLFAALALASTPSWAQQGPATYAVLVGSNQAGPGQLPLQYAVRDAERMEQVLTELGGFDTEDIRLVEDPGAGELLGILDSYAAILGAHAAQDEDALFLFYYSGHAKASGLQLGSEELGLEALEAKLEALPATLTLAVLDACQAGAISGVKGAVPAEGFSYNVSEGLSTRGLAVMASSTGTELSQESTELEGSYFTHHLVTGLRGAADDDYDGRVTLAEAYAYTYHHTLVSTAATAVGRQHVTLETRIEGKGETVLTRPKEASAILRLPMPMQGDMLIYGEKDRTVSAELHKVEGTPLTVAMVPGRYQAVLRKEDGLFQCVLELDEGTNTFLGAGCEKVAEITTVSPKGLVVQERHERLMLELSMGDGVELESDYTDRLDEFGFDEEYNTNPLRLTGSLVYTVRPFLGAVLTVGNIDSQSFGREFETQDSTRHVISWETWRAAVQVRGSLPLFNSWLTPYVQVGGGPALGLTHYRDYGDFYQENEQHWGWHGTAAAGFQFMPTFPRFRHVGVFHQIEYTQAPVIENLLGDVHLSGGSTVSMGVRVGF